MASTFDKIALENPECKIYEEVKELLTENGFRFGVQCICGSTKDLFLEMIEKKDELFREVSQRFAMINAVPNIEPESTVERISDRASVQIDPNDQVTTYITHNDAVVQRSRFVGYKHPTIIRDLSDGSYNSLRSIVVSADLSEPPLRTDIIDNRTNNSDNILYKVNTNILLKGKAEKKILNRICGISAFDYAGKHFISVMSKEGSKYPINVSVFEVLLSGHAVYLVQVGETTSISEVFDGYIGNVSRYLNRENDKFIGKFDLCNSDGELIETFPFVINMSYQDNRQKEIPLLTEKLFSEKIFPDKKDTKPVIKETKEVKTKARTTPTTAAKKVQAQSKTTSKKTKATN